MLKRLLINTSSNISVLVVKIIITFIMTPIFLHSMGDYDYGVWEIIASIVGYMGVLDLGIKPAITRFTAKYEAENSYEQLQNIYSTAFAFTLSMGLLLSVLLITWGLIYPETLAPESASTTKYTWVLCILAVQMLFMFPGYVPESVLEGFQQYHLKNNVTIINSIVGATVLYYYINEVNALYLLALINTIGKSIKYVVYFFLVSRNKYGGLLPTYRDVSISKLKELLSFGGKSFIQGLAYRVESVTDLLVIGAFLGPAMVPLYSIPANLIAYIRNIGFTLTKAFMPKFSQLLANNDQRTINMLYINASKWVVLFMLPVSMLAVLFGPAFITLWLGKEYGDKSQVILLLLAIFTMIPFLDPFKSRYLTAINKHAILAKLFPIAACINLGVSVLLVEPFGIFGVALGSVIPVMIFMPIYLRYSCQQLGIKVLDYLKQAVVPAIVPNAGLLVSSYFTLQVTVIDNFLKLFVYAGVNLLLYLLFVILFSSKKERALLHGKFFK